nr:uncharacterized protein LOC109158090 [Ipomoea batatas]
MVVPRGRDDESSNDAVSRKNHHRSGDVAGDEIACTGKACKLCTAGMIADCVAVCCCPCAVVDILVLALFKVPWTLGRKWLRKRRNGGGARRICSRRSEGIPRMGSVEDETLGMGSSVSVFGIREQGGKDNFSARFDSEEVWFDLYQEVAARLTLVSICYITNAASRILQHAHQSPHTAWPCRRSPPPIPLAACRFPHLHRRLLPFDLQQLLNLPLRISGSSSHPYQAQEESGTIAFPHSVSREMESEARRVEVAGRPSGAGGVRELLLSARASGGRLPKLPPDLMAEGRGETFPPHG